VLGEGVSVLGEGVSVLGEGVSVVGGGLLLPSPPLLPPPPLPSVLLLPPLLRFANTVLTFAVTKATVDIEDKIVNTRNRKIVFLLFTSCVKCIAVPPIQKD